MTGPSRLAAVGAGSWRRPAGLVGRDREARAVVAFVDDAAPGARALVLEGEAGAGKTSVWGAGLARVRDTGGVMLVARPAEREAGLPFAALGDLLDCAPAAALGAVPEHMRDALEGAALRRPGGDARDALAVARALLALLRGAAPPAAPLLVAVDDVQWLDPPTADALEFALRRAGELRVRLLAARRDGTGGPEPERAVPVAERLGVGPMEVADLDELLRGRLDLALPRPSLLALHAAAGGNPLLAIEIARAARDRGAAIAPGAPLPVPGDVDRLLRARLDAAPSAARRAVLLVAAGLAPAAAVERAGGTGGMEAAVAADLLVVEGERVRLAHPLLGSVAYATATPSRRREAHARLAKEAAAPEARTLHMALAADAPDDDLASVLERAASEAARAGVPTTAAQLAEHAARLTPPGAPADRRRREMAAATHLLAAGDPGRARTALERLLHEAEPGPERARVRFHLVDAISDDYPLAVATARGAWLEAGDDPGLAALAALQLATVLWISGDLRSSVAAGRDAVASAARSGDAALHAMAVADLAHAEVLLGIEPDPAQVAGALATEAAHPEYPWATETRPSRTLGAAHLHRGDLAAARPLLEAQLATAEAAGDDGLLPSVLFRMVDLEWRAGRWGRARELAERGLALARQATGPQAQHALLLSRAMVAAGQGRVDEAREDAGRVLAFAARAGDAMFQVRARGVLGFTALSLGDPAGAQDVLGPAVAGLRAQGLREHSSYMVSENAVEALAALGALDEAEALAGEVAASGRPWGRAVGARGRALVAAARDDLPAARGLALEAAGHLTPGTDDLERARALLTLGAVERRARRRAAARDPIEAALAVFTALGARVWAERARDELRRLGLRLAPAGLTATEAQVAELAAQGMTNREIASALFLSVKTVEVNLTRAYRKLGIRSRVELAGRLARERTGEAAG